MAKPGIIAGNLLTAAGGFLLASNDKIDFRLFFSIMLGLGLVIGSACVFNNYIDRGIDAKMSRTRNRALVKGSVRPAQATAFATILAISGFWTFYRVSEVALGLAFVGFFSYVVLYSLTKRRTIYGTLVGTISGATPPLIGYAAAAGGLDKAAWLLFLILVLWQMPHFYAIAIFRLKDYSAAKIPVWPAVKGVGATKAQMLIFIWAFTLSASLMTVLGYTGLVYLGVMLAVSIRWLAMGYKGLKSSNSEAWARRMFGYSLIVILVFSGLLSVESFLP